MTAYLHGFGYYVPDRVVSNAELASRAGRDAAWIESVSGIRERRWAAPEQSIADLAVAAAEDCLRRTEVAASSVGLLIVASGSAARGFPGPAAEVALRLGLAQTPAMDVPMASAGSLFGMDIARRYAAEAGNVLVIGAEKMSAMVGAPGDGPLDPNTAILFGDGAGAALVSSQARGWNILDCVLHSDGQFRDDLKSDGASLAMNGLPVIMQASRKLPSAIKEIVERQRLTPQDVTVFLLHQANLNLLTRVAKSLGVDAGRVFTNVERYGNTSSASMLIAAAEWSSQTPASNGPIVLSAFGAGFHWGALIATSL